MKIKEVGISVINDSRGKPTICIEINKQVTCAPAGKSTGKHEKPGYRGSLDKDLKNVKQIIELSQKDFKKFKDLEVVEALLKNKIGANTLFALEASILKAMAAEQGKELWQFLGGRSIPKILSNTIGGGCHTKASKKPDFQEFLVMGNKKHNTIAYNELKKILKTSKTNDENALITPMCNRHTLELLNYGDVKIGVDVAASEFYKDRKYNYKCGNKKITRGDQIRFMVSIIEDYNLVYVEDPMQEDDFKGFAEILKATKGKCLIVGDDLTTTNLKRVQKAIEMKAINGLIVKPNQIGSLIEVKKVIDLCKKKKIKIIISHRSGETMDCTIADLAVGWGADMIKIPIKGKERLCKVDRIEEIKKKLKK